MNEYSRKPSLDLVLSIITLGIYDFYLIYKIAADTAEVQYSENREKSSKKAALILPFLSLILSAAFIAMWFKSNGVSDCFFFLEPALGVASVGLLSAIWHLAYIPRIYKITAGKAKSGVPAAIISAICAVLGLRIVGFMICDSRLNMQRNEAPQASSKADSETNMQ